MFNLLDWNVGETLIIILYYTLQIVNFLLRDRRSVLSFVYNYYNYCSHDETLKKII